jgi:hypothetical protein
MMRIAVARAISIAGHPVVLLPVAALVAASTQGASARQLTLIGEALVAFGVIVIGFSWWQVRAGRWSHVDASVRGERRSLNIFLGVLCLSGSALLSLLTHQVHMAVALALSGALVVAALTISRWVKMSLHVAFAAFATALLWPNMPAMVAGVLATSAVTWSRLVLGRHLAADVATGLLLGAVAGGGYHLWFV